ncbi:hypothetical protein RFI_30460, partial [Reticulomyxa filosa]
MSSEEQTCTVKYMDTTKVSGVFLASFPGGLPPSIQSDKANFNLLRTMRHKKKNKLLLCEDEPNRILYCGVSPQGTASEASSSICSNPSSKKKGIFFFGTDRQAVGIIDPKTNTLTIIPVTERFEMNPIRAVGVKKEPQENAPPVAAGNAGAPQMTSAETTNKLLVAHEKLVNAFGSKFAVSTLRKRKHLRKTKAASLVSVKSMKPNQIVNASQTNL